MRRAGRNQIAIEVNIAGSRFSATRDSGPEPAASEYHRRIDVTQEQKQDGLTEEELDQEQAEELPDREAMSLINANLAAPVNAAVALNASATTRAPSPTPPSPATSPRRTRDGRRA
jgi:hypothetical protein